MKKTTSGEIRNADPTRYYATTWRNKWLTADAATIGDMIRLLKDAAKDLKEMQVAGVELNDSSCADDYAELYTNDPEVAKRFGFEEQQIDDDELEGDEDSDI